LNGTYYRIMYDRIYYLPFLLFTIHGSHFSISPLSLTPFSTNVSQRQTLINRKIVERTDRDQYTYYPFNKIISTLDLIFGDLEHCQNYLNRLMNMSVINFGFRVYVEEPTYSSPDELIIYHTF
jgi:hypothetical protein